MGWIVTHVDSCDPSPDFDTVEAALVRLARNDQTRRVTVELARTAADSGAEFVPHEVVVPYLGDDEPPEHLIVTTSGVDPAP